MTQNVSGFGLVVTLIADKTFPVGLPITQFADDADPLDMSSIDIADTGMGLNGDLVVWQKAAKLPMVLNVIPNTTDDINLQILADANRVARGKNSAKDSISATILYPDGTTVVLSGGVMVNAQFGRGVSSQMRIKTKTYAFVFQSKA